MATPVSSFHPSSGPGGGTSITRLETRTTSRTGRPKTDALYLYTLPKGRYDRLIGSFSHTPLSTRARQLQQNIYRLQGKLSRVQHENLSPQERAKKVSTLNRQLKYLNCKLHLEVDSLPTISVVVQEAD